MRTTRQAAFLAGVIASFGFLELGKTIEHLLTGDGYGDRFGHYLAKIRATEFGLKNRLDRLEEKIKRIAAIQHASIVAQEMEALIALESSEWNDVRTLDQDLKGNSIVREAFAFAEKIYEKMNLTMKKMTQGLQKIRIKPRLRSIKVHIRPHSVCKWAVMKVTSVTAIPSRECFKKVGTMGKKNLTITEFVRELHGDGKLGHSG